MQGEGMAIVPFSVQWCISISSVLHERDTVQAPYLKITRQWPHMVTAFSEVAETEIIAAAEWVLAWVFTTFIAAT